LPPIRKSRNVISGAEEPRVTKSGARDVKKTEEYIQHASECRTLAKQMEAGEHKEQLLAMADTWEVLAAERERMTLAAVHAERAAQPWMTTVVKN
jgi:hypothetical protein